MSFRKNKVMLLFALFLAACSQRPKGLEETLNENINSPAWDAVSIKNREDKIGKCMRDNGFKYFGTVTAVHGRRRPNSDSASPSELRGRGYGVAGSMLGTEPSLVLETSEDARLKDYLRTLASGDRRAFWSSMYGSGLADAASLGNEIEPIANVGCAGIAGRSTPVALQVGLQQSLLKMETKLRNDPRVAKMQGTWRICMAQSGFIYKDRYEIVNELMEHVGPIMSAGGPSSPKFEALASEERNLAAADAGCLEHEYEKYLTIRKDFEQDFRSAHQNELAQATRILGK